jgi:hypothetical protein
VRSPMGCRFGLTAGLKLASAAKIPKNTSDGIYSIAQVIGLIQGVSRRRIGISKKLGGIENCRDLRRNKRQETCTVKILEIRALFSSSIKNLAGMNEDGAGLFRSSSELDPGYNRKP